MVAVRFPDSGLTTEYGDIILEAASQMVRLEVKLGIVTILQEDYHPNAEDCITIRDLGKLAALYIPSDNALTLSNSDDTGNVILEVILTEAGESEEPISKYVTFYKCDLDFDGSVSVDLLMRMPLSRATTKMTGPGRKEFISFFGNNVISLYAVYSNGSRDVSKLIESFVTLADSGKIYKMNVSPQLIAGVVGCLEESLIYYNLYKDNKVMIRFRMDERRHVKKTTFLFKNTFNAQETITCFGHELNNRKWEREYGQINNNVLQTSKNKTEEISVSTGYLHPEMFPVLDDLLNSENICVIEGNKLRQVIILSEDFSVTSRKNEPRSFEITYRYASNNFKSQYVPFAKPGIFDETFDKSFE